MLGEHTLWNQLFLRQPSCISTQWSRQLSQRGGLKPVSQQAAHLSRATRSEVRSLNVGILIRPAVRRVAGERQKCPRTCLGIMDS